MYGIRVARPPLPVSAQTAAQMLALKPYLEAETARRQGCKFRTWFPDSGPYRRELYPWAVTWMNAGAVHKERLLLAANKVGKTQTAAFEISAHLTGLYPHWWAGFRFQKPNAWWAAGDTMETTRDVPQTALMGPHDGVPRQEWSGMIPPHLIHHTARKSGGIPNCLAQVWVKHVSGGLSTLAWKSYDQGRRSFQGTDQDGIWVDEEPPDAGENQQSDIYTECLLRTMVTGGLVLATFTPLRGLTAFVEHYLEDALMPDPGTGKVVSAMKAFWPDEEKEEKVVA